jgi:DNA-binding phage protein
LAQLTLSTWSVMKPYLRNPSIRPFDFLIVATPTRSFSDFAQAYTACCEDPRPSCFLFNDPADWTSQEWRCLRCGELTPTPRLRSYESVLHGTLDSFEVKRLCADGSEPGPNTIRGLTIARPVRVQSVTSIGKEVIVDPTDSDEGLTAEMLSETSTIECVDLVEALNELRARVREAGVRNVSEKAGLSRHHIQGFLNAGTSPHLSSIAKLEEAIAADHREKDHGASLDAKKRKPRQS